MSAKDIGDEELAAMQEEAEEFEAIVITDDKGEQSFFQLEMIIPYKGKNYAVLVPCEEECDDEECECHHQHDEEDDACIIARMEFDEEGKEVFVSPTDEEFAAVVDLYMQDFGDEADE